MWSLESDTLGAHLHLTQVSTPHSDVRNKTLGAKMLNVMPGTKKRSMTIAIRTAGWCVFCNDERDRCYLGPQRNPWFISYTVTEYVPWKSPRLYET